MIKSSFFSHLKWHFGWHGRYNVCDLMAYLRLLLIIQMHVFKLMFGYKDAKQRNALHSVFWRWCSQNMSCCLHVSGKCTAVRLSAIIALEKAPFCTGGARSNRVTNVDRMNLTRNFCVMICVQYHVVEQFNNINTRCCVTVHSQFYCDIAPK